MRSKLALLGLLISIAIVVGVQWRSGPPSSPRLGDAPPHTDSVDPMDPGPGSHPLEPREDGSRSSAANGLPSSNTESAVDSRLHGIVVDSAGNPIHGASILVLRPVGSHDVCRPRAAASQTRVAELTSDEQGRFGTLVPEGLGFHLVVRSQGHSALGVPSVTAGEDLVIVLRRPASLSGRVLNGDNGEPCVGASVRCSPVRPDEPGPTLMESLTDATGRFEFEELAPGSMKLDVLAQGLAPLDQMTIHLAEGEAGTRDLFVDPGTEIEGVVLDAETRAPIAGAVVGSAHAFDSPFRHHATTTDAAGRFLLRGAAHGLSATLIGVRAKGYGFESVKVWATVERTPPVEVLLEPGLSVRGSLVDASGSPVAGASVDLLGRGWSSISANSDRLNSRSDADGRFEVHGLRSDLYWSLRIDTDVSATRLLALPAPPLRGDSVDFGVIALSAPAMLRGRLVDQHGDGIAGFYVCLYTDHFDGGPYESAAPPSMQDGRHQVRTDSQGRFAFSGLEAGPWSLWAGVKGCARTIERKVDVGLGIQHEELRLELNLGESISGTLFAPDGAVVADCLVEFRPAGGGLPRAGYLLTGADGTFRMTGLEEGQYELVARPSVFLSNRARASLPTCAWEMIDAGAEDLRLVLSASEVITGVVELADGSHAPGCSVHAFRSDGSPADRPVDTDFTDANGRFRLVVEKGRMFRLQATRFDSAVREETYEVGERAEVSAGSEGLLLRLAAAR